MLRDIRTAIFLVLLPWSASAQLIINNTLTPGQLVQDVLLGDGIVASNISFNGVAEPAQSFISTASFTAAGTNLGIDAGVLLATGTAQLAIGPSNVFSSYYLNTGSDPDLVALTNANIYDVSVLEFDFVPDGDSIKFSYVFASEEYPSFVCSPYNDAFGFFLSGPCIDGPFSNNSVNLALIPGTNIPVTINSVNSGTPGGSYQAATCAITDPNWQNNSVHFVEQWGRAASMEVHLVRKQR